MDEITNKMKRRTKKPVRFSPTPRTPTSVRNKKNSTTCSSQQPCEDILPDGSCFLCERCGTNSLNKHIRGRKAVSPSKVVHPRLRYVPDTGEQIMLCHTCGLIYDRERRTSVAKVATSKAVMSEEQILDISRLTQYLVQQTLSADVELIICKNVKKRLCQCSQMYLKSTSEGLVSRAQSLLELVKVAKQLRSKKMYDPSSNSSSSKVAIGLGNGHKRSREYEQLVLAQRQVLRRELGFCESVTQRILGYSNSFLHKRLRTEQRCRLSSDQPAAFVPISSLSSERCCRDKCVNLCRTHQNLVTKWRTLAQESQSSARQVVAEMLTPAAASKTNCYRFVTMVTGCSSATISKVVQRLRNNHGVLGNSDHGLKRYWREKKCSAAFTKKPVTAHRKNVTRAPVINRHKAVTLGQQQPPQPTNQQKETSVSSVSAVSDKALNVHQKRVKSLQSLVQLQKQEIEQQKALITALTEKQAGCSLSFVNVTPKATPTSSELRKDKCVDPSGETDRCGVKLIGVNPYLPILSSAAVTEMLTMQCYGEKSKATHVDSRVSFPDTSGLHRCTSDPSWLNGYRSIYSLASIPNPPQHHEQFAQTGHRIVDTGDYAHMSQLASRQPMILQEIQQEMLGELYAQLPSAQTSVIAPNINIGLLPSRISSSTPSSSTGVWPHGSESWYFGAESSTINDVHVISSAAKHSITKNPHDRGWHENS